MCFDRSRSAVTTAMRAAHGDSQPLRRSTEAAADSVLARTAELRDGCTGDHFARLAASKTLFRISEFQITNLNLSRISEFQNFTIYGEQHTPQEATLSSKGVPQAQQLWAPVANAKARQAILHLSEITGFHFVRRLDFPFCPKDTEQVKRLCQSTERYERQRRNLTHTRNAAERQRI